MTNIKVKLPRSIDPNYSFIQNYKLTKKKRMRERLKHYCESYDLIQLKCYLFLF